MKFLLETKKMLTSHLDMKYLGNVSFVLGIEILCDRSHGVLALSKKKYVEKVLNRFNMKLCNPYAAPIQKGERPFNFQCSQNDN